MLGLGGKGGLPDLCRDPRTTPVRRQSGLKVCLRRHGQGFSHELKSLNRLAFSLCSHRVEQARDTRAIDLWPQGAEPQVEC